MQNYTSYAPAIQPMVPLTLHPTVRRIARLPTSQRLPHALVLAALLLAFPPATLTTATATPSTMSTSSRLTSAPHAQAPAAALNAAFARHLSAGIRSSAQASVVIQSVRRTVAKARRQAAQIVRRATTTVYAFTPSGGISQWAYTGHAAYGEPSGGTQGYAWGWCTAGAAQFAHDNVSGLGNAGGWAQAARARGMAVTSTPHAGATVVFAPGVQGAGGSGHVAHVLTLYAGGWFLLSEVNFTFAGGGFGRVSFRYAHAGPGVAFIL